MKIGTGSFVIRNNKVIGTEANNHHVYGIYSPIDNNSTPLFIQTSGKFSKNNYVDSIAFAHTTGFGVLMRNWKDNAETPDNYESQLHADTYNRATLKTLMNGDDLVVNDGYFVEFMLDKKTYAGIATQTIIAKGRIARVASPSDPSGYGHKFIGWATKSNAKENEVIDFDTFEVTENIKLYAIFDRTHIHKVCSATGSCTHKDIASHSEVITWEPFPEAVATDQINNYINGTAGGLGKYIYLEDDITLTGESISLTRDVYICLNGYNRWRGCSR